MRLTRRAVLAAGAGALVGGRAAADVNMNNLLAPRWFGAAELEDRARRLAQFPHDPPGRRVPASINGLDWDAWREIRFKPDGNLLDSPNSRFRLQAFHLGHLFKRPVRLNLVRGDVAEPIAYSANDFDYGHHAFDPPLPAHLGYAG